MKGAGVARRTHALAEEARGSVAWVEADVVDEDAAPTR